MHARGDSALLRWSAGAPSNNPNPPTRCVRAVRDATTERSDATAAASASELAPPRPSCLLQRAQTDVLSLETEGLYRPKTRETRAAYETLLSQIQAQFGDQPQVRGGTMLIVQLRQLSRPWHAGGRAVCRQDTACVWSR